MLVPSDIAGPKSQRSSQLFTSPSRSGGMCKPAGIPAKGESATGNGIGSSSSSSSNNNSHVGGKAPSPVALSRMSSIAALVPPFARSLAQPPFTQRKIVLLVILSSVLLSSAVLAGLYTFHRGFRRTVQIWRGMLPLVAKYKWLKIRATKIDGLTEDDDEYRRRITAYRQTTAPQLVDLILSLGGIYTKIGQVSILGVSIER